MKKTFLEITLKFGIWLLVRKMRKEVEKVKDIPERMQAYREVANALLTICQNVALLYGINVKIKYIDPTISNIKREKRMEKQRKKKKKKRW